MKRLLQNFLIIGLALAGEGAILRPPAAWSAPAPIFEPLVENIRVQLPSGSVMRLPSYLPNSSVKLYPIVESDKNGFRINMTIKPNCRSASCTGGSIGIAFDNNNAIWPPKGDQVKAVALNSDISGYRFTRGQGRRQARYVVWKQDGQVYFAGAMASAVSEGDMMAIAQSMVNEPPIK